MLIEVRVTLYLRSSNKRFSFRAERGFTLKSRDDFCHQLDYLWVFTEALIAPPPSGIPTHLNIKAQLFIIQSTHAFMILNQEHNKNKFAYCNTWSKDVGNACSSNFKSNCCTNFFSQFRVPAYMHVLSVNTIKLKCVNQYATFFFHLEPINQLASHNRFCHCSTEKSPQCFVHT